MNYTTLYRLSLGLTILLTLIAFFFLIASLGALINGWGKEPWTALLPWKTLILVAIAGINCSIRKRLIKTRG
jgi:hypothetical protein